MADTTLTPIGYYTAAEVSRLAGVSSRKIGSWARYGIILPSGGAAAYEQDGVLFDVHDNEVGSTDRRRTKTPRAELEARAEAEMEESGDGLAT